MFVELYFTSFEKLVAEAKNLIEKGYLVFIDKRSHRGVDKVFYVLTYDKKQELIEM